MSELPRRLRRRKAASQVAAASSSSYRVFFLREHEDGYCYCFSQPV